MTSDSVARQDHAFVWVWRPGETEPVVAGRVDQDRDRLLFTYGRSYLERNPPFPVYLPELPLRRGVQEPLPGLSVAGCIRDGVPDAWGRRVINRRVLGRENAARAELNDLTYMIESGSDRIGALDFQASATVYNPRAEHNATLEELQEAAERIEKDLPLSPDPDQAILHVSSIGGARPKALVQDGDRKYIAKFSSTSDVYSVVKAEFVAMRLGLMAGLDVAPVRLARSAGKDALLVERFDRAPAPSGENGWQRRAMVSALTMLGLDEMMARYASYQDLAEIIRQRFERPADTNRELFSRLVFNILCGNTDDHARNHAAFWDGGSLALTPAYDICPQGRSGNEASQGMLVFGNNNRSTLASCYSAAQQFGINDREARDIVDTLRQSILDHWNTVCDEAGLNETDRRFLWGRQFLNPSIDY